MNQQEIIEAFRLPKVMKSEEFIIAYRELTTLLRNVDRAAGRLANAANPKANRRTTKKSKVTSAPSGETT